MSHPDSGSDQNIISLEMVNRLGLEIQESDREQRHFSLANGKTVESIGQISAPCSFVAGNLSDASGLECIFHVFSSLTVSVIMGMEFLHQTETLTKHTNRLMKGTIHKSKRFKEKDLSDLGDILYAAWKHFASRDFVRFGGFKIEPAYELVEFADGSVGCTSGVIRAPFAVGSMSDARGFLPRCEAIDVEFYVLDGLKTDILIGHRTIEDIDIFCLHNEAFIPTVPGLGESDVSIIRHIGTMERLASKALRKLKNKILKTPSTVQSRDAEHSSASPPTWVDDQRENARREVARAEIAKLTGAARLTAEEEEAARVLEYEKKQGRDPEPAADRLSTLAEPAIIPGDDDSVPAPPTPCLPNDGKPHPPSVLYYRPVKGGLRSKTGKRFMKEKKKGKEKEKKQITKHRLIHEFSDYQCPFCDHKFSSSPYLEGHVRVYHVDIEKDDPELLKALAADDPETKIPLRILWVPGYIFTAHQLLLVLSTISTSVTLSSIATGLSSIVMLQCFNCLVVSAHDAQALQGVVYHPSASFPTKVWSTIFLFFNLRGVKTPWKVKEPNKFPQFYKLEAGKTESQGQAGPSKGWFIFRQLLVIAWHYVFMDIYETAGRETPPNATPEQWAGRVAIGLAWLGPARAVLDFYYRLLGLALVVPGFIAVDAWPPLFGRAADLYTLRGFWGSYWHQWCRLPLTSMSNYVARDVLRLPRPSLVERYINLFIVFFFSGLVHLVVDGYMAIPPSESGALQYFPAAALGIMLEDGVQGLWRRISGASSRKESKGQGVLLWHRLVGYVWVAFWMILTTPWYIFPVTRINPVDNWCIPGGVVSRLGMPGAQGLLAVGGLVLVFGIGGEI
ncbi:Acetyltransferase TRI7 [Cladobotryum mycophilum]|uniref:Acetyltransferase TRI7 n=1 Tax=Cladobotryum mycophilum TaxID=491253 RepID=A0ABR0T3M3_9HYPO